MREFLSRGRKDKYTKTCRHCQADSETCPHIIGNCPRMQDARIKRHNHIGKVPTEEGKKKGWVVLQEPRTRDTNEELPKPDLVFVKDDPAFVVDVTVRYETTKTAGGAAAEKVNKYSRLRKEIQHLTNAKEVVFMGFPTGSGGKWHQGNFGLLGALGLSKPTQEKSARSLSSIALVSSVDIVHVFASKSRDCTVL
ncbi:hypothetical protein HGM15179_020807 [Zosterops borbonicus]|uniref:Reverse transcriptase n=1 Tax=Zosterops borbonicus TaxID=364589 RepID=A0A8K1D5N7_9PASS|nr:hypothetical protein HGM15179_020807 [Zosterops borbonicus]